MFEKVTIPDKYPEVTVDSKEVFKLVQFEEEECAKLTISCAGGNLDKKEV